MARYTGTHPVITVGGKEIRCHSVEITDSEPPEKIGAVSFPVTTISFEVHLTESAWNRVWKTIRRMALVAWLRSRFSQN